MYNHAPADYDCPLCKLAEGGGNPITDQDDVVFHDDLITVFIAGKWRISNPGHVIIIPNKHIENLYDMENKYLHRIAEFSKDVAIALKEVYKCDGVSTRQHNEPAGNQDVWHYHLHVAPRYAGDNMYINDHEIEWPSKERRLPYAQKLRKYFANIKK
ncbi:MAG TPA: HIT family protein [Patescibacteria group bacterium]|nr:HIT family protein [Patescibacteria group bacterium]